LFTKLTTSSSEMALLEYVWALHGWCCLMLA
jgi:hypothetical protein